MNWSQRPPNKPTTFGELFGFYHEYVKPLYGLVQAEGALPQEMLFEINAALDHLSRHWTFNEPEEAVVNKAFGHFKRSCLDVFKILVREAEEQYKELRKIDTSAIEHGDFDRNLHRLWTEIKSGSVEARTFEGQPDNDLSVPAFEKWQSVASKCLQLQHEFFHHKHLEWAKRRAVSESFSTRLKRWADGAVLTAGIYLVAMPERFTVALAVLVAVLWAIAYGRTLFREGGHWKEQIKSRYLEAGGSRS